MALPAKPAALYLDKLDIQVMTTPCLAPDPPAAWIERLGWPLAPLCMNK
jgi:hypothetical protein